MDCHEKYGYNVVIPAAVVEMDIARGEVHDMSASQPEMRRPSVLEIPTTAIK